jgi:hypothetical protein
MSYIQHARYNGKVGLYPQGIEQFTMILSPPPNTWYDASTGNLLIDRVGNLNLTGPTSYLKYDNKLNGLTIASSSSTNSTYVAGSGVTSSSYNNTIVTVGYTTSSEGYFIECNNKKDGLFSENWHLINKNNFYLMTSYSGRTASTTTLTPVNVSVKSGTWNISVSKHLVTATYSDADFRYNEKNETGGPFTTPYDDTTTTKKISIYPKLSKIAEVLVYDRILTDDEILSVEKYLKAKWGLSY